MEVVRCSSCDKELDLKMEIEYSREVNEFYCNADCATNRYFEYMQSMVFDKEDKDFLNEEEVKIVKGKLYHNY